MHGGSFWNLTVASLALISPKTCSGRQAIQSGQHVRHRRLAEHLVRVLVDDLGVVDAGEERDEVGDLVLDDEVVGEGSVFCRDLLAVVPGQALVHVEGPDELVVRDLPALGDPVVGRLERVPVASDHEQVLVAVDLVDVVRPADERVQVVDLAHPADLDDDLAAVGRRARALAKGRAGPEGGGQAQRDEQQNERDRPRPASRPSSWLPLRDPPQDPTGGAATGR